MNGHFRTSIQTVQTTMIKVLATMFIMIALIDCSPLRRRDAGHVHLHNSLQRRLHTTAKKQKPEHPLVVTDHGIKRNPKKQFCQIRNSLSDKTGGDFWRLRSSYSSRNILSSCSSNKNCQGRLE